MTPPDQDMYGVVFNGPNTFKCIAEHLVSERGCVIAQWTDGRMSMHDVMFFYNPPKLGHIGRGMALTELFVGVQNHTFFGFSVWSTSELVGEYVEEKIGVPLRTAERLADLITGVRHDLRVLLVEDGVTGFEK